MRRMGPALLARAEELEADLLVMAVSRSRMRNRISGGVSQQFLDHHDIALVIVIGIRPDGPPA